jgi:hypothetical protein
MRLCRNLVPFLMVTCWAVAFGSDDATSVSSKLPEFVIPKNQDWYGAIAKQHGLEGRVLVALNVAADGHANNVSVIWAEDSVLSANTLQLLTAIHFKVPAHWGTADVARRWYVGFVYRLCPSGQPGEFAIPVEPIHITGSRLPSAPVRTSPATKESDTCLQAP